MWYYYRCVTRPMIAKNATNAHVSSLYRSTRLYFCCSDIIWCVFVCIPLQLYRHYVLLAVHFYGRLYAPASLPQSVIFLLGSWSIRCLVADSLLLCWFAQPFVFLVCVYHVWVCSFVLHYFIMLQVKTLVLMMHRCHAWWRWDPSSLPSEIP